MIEYLVLLSCIGFLAFLIPGRHQKYAAIFGWTFIVLFLFAELPYYFSLNNFLYPIMAVLSVPFLVITLRAEGFSQNYQDFIVMPAGQAKRIF